LSSEKSVGALPVLVLGSVEVLLELCGREVAEVAVQALGVVRSERT
jgi:hypothetical protein